MSKKDNPSRAIREAVGVYGDEAQLHGAIDELTAAGFASAEIGLLAGEFTVRESLGEFYTKTNAQGASADAPNTAFIAKESVGDTARAGLGSLFYAGTTVAGGMAVASAAVLGGGLLAAVTGAAAIGAVGGVLALLIHQSDAEHLEQQVDEGHLLLFVRVRDAAHEDHAVAILRKYDPIEVRVVDAPAERA
jgi:hypothetical protein